MSLLDFLSQLLNVDREAIFNLVIIIVFLGGLLLVRSNTKGDDKQNQTIQALATSWAEFYKALIEVRDAITNAARDVATASTTSHTKTHAYLDDITLRLTRIEAKLDTPPMVTLNPESLNLILDKQRTILIEAFGRALEDNRKASQEVKREGVGAPDNL